MYVMTTPRPRTYTLTAADLLWGRLIATLKQADAAAARGDADAASDLRAQADATREAWRAL